MDDSYNIVGNPQLRSIGAALRAALMPWGTQASDGWTHGLNAAYWRPMTTLSWAIDTAIFGQSPAAMHAINIAIHVANAGLVALLAFALGLGARAAALAATLFAVHAVHSEAVTLITYRTELLATFFTLVAMRHAVADDRGGRPWLLGLCLAAALASKESGAALALIYGLWVVIDGQARGDGVFTALRRRAPALTVLALVLVGWLVARSSLVQSTTMPYLASLSPLQRWASVGVILGKETSWLALPWPLAPFWDKTMVPLALSLLDPSAIAGWLAVVVAATVAVVTRKGAPVVAIGAAWWLAGLLPTAQIVALPVGAAERFVYLSSVGALIALAAVLDRSGRLKQRSTLAIAAVAIMVHGAGSARRALDFVDDATLVRATVRDHPDGFSGWHYLGAERLKANDLDQASIALDHAAEILPGFLPNERLRVDAALAAGDFDRAAALAAAVIADGAADDALQAAYQTARLRGAPAPTN